VIAAVSVLAKQTLLDGTLYRAMWRLMN